MDVATNLERYEAETKQPDEQAKNETCELFGTGDRHSETSYSDVDERFERNYKTALGKRIRIARKEGSRAADRQLHVLGLHRTKGEKYIDHRCVSAASSAKRAALPQRLVRTGQTATQEASSSPGGTTLKIKNLRAKNRKGS